jgi:hypothetical protein
MDKFLESEPLLCVRSDVFFKFQARRLKELMNVQLAIAKRRPKNYGIMTAVNMHLMRHVPHSPKAIEPYLSEALQDLQFRSVIGTFGMFFLHELDIDRAYLPEIQQEDTAKCRAVFKKSKTGRKDRPNRLPVERRGPSEEYPIGNAPTWGEIQGAMERDPGLLMREWVWEPLWEGHEGAASLFVDFTVDMFSLLDDAAYSSERPKPTSLEEAMECWTVSSLQINLLDRMFSASTYQLMRKFQGKTNPGFGDYVDIYFPPPGVKLHARSLWRSLVSKGYIGKYHDLLEEMSDEDIEVLNFELRKMFGRLQCLPDASLTSVGKLWPVGGGSIQLLTNPIFYKIERISSGKRLTRKVFRVKASRPVIEARLDGYHRGITFDQAKGEARKLLKAKKKSLARKSTKNKNKRVPPQRKKPEKEKTPSTTELNEEEDEMDIDQLESSSDEMMEVEEDEEDEDVEMDLDSYDADMSY